MTRSNRINYLIWLRIRREVGVDADEVLAHEPENEAELELHAILKQAISAGQAELKGVSDDDLEGLIAAEEVRHQREMQEAEARRVERERFFHQPSAEADFAAWSLMDTWTLDQAAALVLKKEPTVVTWERVSEHVETSPFAREFAKVRAFLDAADIEFPVRPADFIDWAAQKGVPVPPRLIELIRARTKKIFRSEPEVEAAKMESTEEPVVETEGESDETGWSQGRKHVATRNMLLKSFGVDKPSHLSKTEAFEEVKARLAEEGIKPYSRSTFDREWRNLYSTFKKRQTGSS